MASSRLDHSHPPAPAIAVHVNLGDFNLSFTAEAVGLAGCGARGFTARDLFRRQDLGVFRVGFWREVDESSMLLLRLACAPAS